MRILITGATGFVGRTLARRLHAKGHALVAWCRSPGSARSALPEGTEIHAAGDDDALVRSMNGCDALVHLAGENLFGSRWTTRQKERLWRSRVGLGERLVEAMKGCQSPPGIVVGTSAVGYYGNTHEICTEDTSPSDDYLAALCVAWERALEPALALGARVATLRVGVVLGAGGGALDRMVPIFRLGLGGIIGSGKQPLSWIHLDDLIDVYCLALEQDTMTGAFNATAPTPSTNAELTRALGEVLGRPTPFPVPAAVLRLAIGGAATVVTGGQPALPERLLAAHHPFRHQDLESAIRAVLESENSVST